MNAGPLTVGLRLSAADRRRAFEAAAQLTRASLELRWLPAAWALELLGAPRSGAPAAPVVTASAREADRVGRTVAAVAARLPWRPTCLRQALAAQRMLRRRGIVGQLHLGVATAQTSLAHAWVTVDGQAVVGRRGVEQFVPLVAFE